MRTRGRKSSQFLTNLKSGRDELHERAKELWPELKTQLDDTLTVKYVANAGFILMICAICFQQCYSQISEYLKYNTRLQVSHDLPKSPLWLMPGLTVCNSNRVRMDQLRNNYPELSEKLNMSVSADLATDQTDRINLAKQIIDNSVNVSEIIWKSSMTKLFSLAKGFMIKDVNCNFLWGPQYNCENIRIIESFQDGLCYTLFYYGSTLEALDKGWTSITDTSMIGGQRKLSFFEDHEIVELLVDFEPHQRVDFHFDLGGKLVVHSTGHIGSIRDTWHQIKPGFRYDIVIKRYVTKRLPPPYKSMCYHYREKNARRFLERESSAGSIELDKTTCLRNCIMRQTARSCKCWPVEIPYFEGDTLIPNGSSLPMCPWNSEGFVELNKSNNSYSDCYKKFLSGCNAKCQLGCLTEDYRVSVIPYSWPSRTNFLIAKDESTRSEVLRLKRCCARISIKYLEFMENQHIMSPSITLAQLISNIGGIVSALVGVSAVTIYRFITRRILRCRVARNSLISLMFT